MFTIYLPIVYVPRPCKYIRHTQEDLKLIHAYSFVLTYYYE